MLLKIKISILILLSGDFAFADTLLKPIDFLERNLAVFQIYLEDIHKEHGYSTSGGLRHFDRSNEFACQNENSFALDLAKENINDKKIFIMKFYRCGNVFNELVIEQDGKWQDQKIYEENFQLQGIVDKSSAHLLVKSTRMPIFKAYYDRDLEELAYRAQSVNGEELSLVLKAKKQAAYNYIALRFNDGHLVVKYKEEVEFFPDIRFSLNSRPISPIVYQEYRKELLSYPSYFFMEVYRSFGGYTSFTEELLL